MAAPCEEFFFVWGSRHRCRMEVGAYVLYSVYMACCTVQCGWYWGAMSFDEAEAMLASRRDGSFLVRDSSDERYILSLSFRSLGGTHHTRIEHYKGTVSID